MSSIPLPSDPSPEKLRISRGQHDAARPRGASGGRLTSDRRRVRRALRHITLNKPALSGDAVVMEGGFEIELTGHPEGMRVTISGELDAVPMRALVARLWSGGASATDTIVLDLSEVTDVDVGGVEELFALKELLGRRLRLERSRPHERDRIPALRPADPHRGAGAGRRSLVARR